MLLRFHAFLFVHLCSLMLIYQVLYFALSFILWHCPDAGMKFAWWQHKQTWRRVSMTGRQGISEQENDLEAHCSRFTFQKSICTPKLHLSQSCVSQFQTVFYINYFILCTFWNINQEGHFSSKCKMYFSCMGLLSVSEFPQETVCTAITGTTRTPLWICCTAA